MEHYLPRAYFLVLLWTLCVLLGMIGLGRLVAKLTGSPAAAQAGWGLHAVFGMGAYIFIGGLMASLGAASDVGITLLISVGLIALLWTAARADRPLRTILGALPLRLWPAYGIAALSFFGGLFWQYNINGSDDLPAYHSFCEKLLTTGSFDEPFSWRRLASLGGHTLLQCSVLARGSFSNAQAFEIALCPWILLGLVLGFRKGALVRSPAGLPLSLLAVSTPIIRANTTSHFTGVVLLTGLFVTLDLAENAGLFRRRLLLVAALLAAAACTLRAVYVPAAIGALSLHWLISWVRDRSPARVAIAEAGCMAAALFAALLPWMVMSFRSNGTPLFPLFQGNNNLAFNPLSVDATFHKQLEQLVRMLLYPGLLPLVVCLLAIPNWKRGVAAPAVGIASIFAALALAYSINLAPDEITVPRYTQPLFLAAAISALLSAALYRRGSFIAGALALFVIVITFEDRRQHLWYCYKAIGDSGAYAPHVPPRLVAEHLKAQLLVPEGKRIFVCSDTPYLFDFHRNPIWIADMPHAASPSPGLPFQKFAEETKKYLQELGVEYVIYQDFNTSYFYGRSRRESEANCDVALFRIWAPFFLDFFATLEKLDSSEAKLGRTGKLIVFQFKS